MNRSRSSNESRDHLSAVDERDGTSQGIGVGFVRIDAEQRTNGVQKIGNAHWVASGSGGLLVGFADDLSRSNAAAREQDALRHGPMVATGLRVHSRRSSHLAHHDDERFVEQTTLFEVGDQGRERSIRRRNQIARERREAIEMDVPAGRVDADEATTGFDESTSEEGGLADLRESIRLAQLLRFVLDLECFASGGGGDEFVGLRVVGRHRGRPTRSLSLLFEAGEQLLAALLARRGDSVELPEVFDFEVGLAGVGFNDERRVFGSKKSGTASSHGVGHIDVGRNGAIARSQFASDHGTERRVKFVVGDGMFAVGERGSSPRHDVVVAGGVSVVVVRVAADDGELVGDLGAVGAVFGELNTGEGGGDRVERAADFGGGIGLRIPHVLLRRSAFEKDKDARFRSSSASGLCLIVGGEEFGERERGEERRGAELEEVAAVESIAGAEGRTGSRESEHEILSRAFAVACR